MKITIVLGPFYAMPPAAYGAVERVWYELACAFARRGHEVRLIGKGEFAARSERCTPLLTLSAVKGYNATGNIAVDLLKDLVYGLAVSRRVERSDVVVSNSFWFPVIARLMPGRVARLVVHVARFPKHQMWLYRGADVLQAISGAVAAEVSRQCPELSARVAVLPYPIDTSMFKPPAAARDYTGVQTLLYVGRVHPEKGLHVLLGAFRRVCAPGRRLRLRIVGPADVRLGGGGPAYLDELKRLAHDLPVEFAPPLHDRAELAREYQRAHCFCYPSLAERGEALGLAPLEAMATGLPVVVSGLACFRDYLEPGVEGLAFDHRAARPEGALAEALDTVLGDAALARQLGERAARKAERYELEAVAQQYLELLARTATGVGAPAHMGWQP